MTASTGSKARPRLSSEWPRKVNSTFPKERAWPGEADSVLPAAKRPGSQDHSAHDECGEGHSLPRNASYAALRDIAHELGLGYIARSTVAFADLSDVADIGRVGILRNYRSHHAVARREIRRQRRADRHHAAGDRHRRHRYHSRVRSGPGRVR